VAAAALATTSTVSPTSPESRAACPLPVAAQKILWRTGLRAGEPPGARGWTGRSRRARYPKLPFFGRSRSQPVSRRLAGANSLGPRRLRAHDRAEHGDPSNVLGVRSAGCLALVGKWTREPTISDLDVKGGRTRWEGANFDAGGRLRARQAPRRRVPPDTSFPLEPTVKIPRLSAAEPPLKF